MADLYAEVIDTTTNEVVQTATIDADSLDEASNTIALVPQPSTVQTQPTTATGDIGGGGGADGDISGAASDGEPETNDALTATLPAAGIGGGEGEVATALEQPAPDMTPLTDAIVAEEPVPEEAPEEAPLDQPEALTTPAANSGGGGDISQQESPPANQAPTDLSLSGGTVAENVANGTVVGTASSTDPDAGDTFIYTLEDNAGGRFAIDSSTGVITVADGSLLNFEATNSHDVTVRVTDSAGNTFDEVMNLDLTDVNETPTDLTLSANSVNENAVNGAVIGIVAPADPDAGDTFTYNLTDDAGGRFSIDNSTGQITVADGSLLNFEAANSHNVTVRVTDSAGNTFDRCERDADRSNSRRRYHVGEPAQRRCRWHGHDKRCGFRRQLHLYAHK
jgi:hypothetical protein